MLSTKPGIGVLRAFHEITPRCTLIPCCWTATGQWELQFTLALYRLVHSFSAQDADNKVFRDL